MSTGQVHFKREIKSLCHLAEVRKTDAAIQRVKKCACVCVCVCESVCVRERESVCLCVCVSE